MATAVPSVPEQSRETVLNDLYGMGNFFIDPGGAAQCIFRRWFWVMPVALMATVAMLVQAQMIPVVQHVLELTPPPANSDPSSYQKGIQIALTIQHVVLSAMPLFVLALLAIQAGLVTGTSSLLGMKVKFLHVFNLIAGVSLIGALAGIATVIILRAKGEISSMADMKPPLGLDIFLPENANKYLLAILSYFSIFQVWMIVMFVLTFSIAFRARKSSALAAYVPVIVLSLLFMLVGAAFQPR